jgi:hypothetical protein
MAGSVGPLGDSPTVSPAASAPAGAAATRATAAASIGSERQRLRRNFFISRLVPSSIEQVDGYSSSTSPNRELKGR